MKTEENGKISRKSKDEIITEESIRKLHDKTSEKYSLAGRFGPLKGVHHKTGGALGFGSPGKIAQLRQEQLLDAALNQNPFLARRILEEAERNQKLKLKQKKLEEQKLVVRELVQMDKTNDPLVRPIITDPANFSRGFGVRKLNQENLPNQLASSLSDSHLIFSHALPSTQRFPSGYTVSQMREINSQHKGHQQHIGISQAHLLKKLQQQDLAAASPSQAPQALPMEKITFTSVFRGDPNWKAGDNNQSHEALAANWCLPCYDSEATQNEALTNSRSCVRIQQFGVEDLEKAHKQSELKRDILGRYSTVPDRKFSNVTLFSEPQHTDSLQSPQANSSSPSYNKGAHKSGFSTRANTPFLDNPPSWKKHALLRTESNSSRDTNTSFGSLIKVNIEDYLQTVQPILDDEVSELPFLQQKDTLSPTPELKQTNEHLQQKLSSKEQLYNELYEKFPSSRSSLERETTVEKNNATKSNFIMLGLITHEQVPELLQLERLLEASTKIKVGKEENFSNVKSLVLETVYKRKARHKTKLEKLEIQRFLPELLLWANVASHDQWREACEQAQTMVHPIIILMVDLKKGCTSGTKREQNRKKGVISESGSALNLEAVKPVMLVTLLQNSQKQDTLKVNSLYENKLEASKKNGNMMTVSVPFLKNPPSEDCQNENDSKVDSFEKKEGDKKRVYLDHLQTKLKLSATQQSFVTQKPTLISKGSYSQDLEKFGYDRLFGVSKNEESKMTKQTSNHNRLTQK